ncbi:hypothetical protein [Thiolinea disciformis]|uniref:hypothetical protein n=1 Tax=Thiolinea disciformis TaxID=125614 RepID=UPI00035D1C13|nr:hypothetical protein [Thiolinea disciformis]
MAYPLYGAYRPAPAVCGYDAWGPVSCNNHWNRPAWGHDRPWGRYNTWDRPWGYNNWNSYRPWNANNWGNNNRPWGPRAWNEPQDVNIINIINRLSNQANAESTSNSNQRTVV